MSLCQIQSLFPSLHCPVLLSMGFVIEDSFDFSGRQPTKVKVARTPSKKSSLENVEIIPKSLHESPNNTHFSNVTLLMCRSDVGSLLAKTLVLEIRLTVRSINGRRMFLLLLRHTRKA